MKNLKVLALLMVLVLSVSVLAACSSKPAETTAPAPETTAPAPETTTPETTAPAADALKDGVYTAAYDNFDAHGWKAQVEVEVKDAKIANVKFDYVNKDGALKSKDEAYKASMEPVAKTYPEKAFNELQAALLEKQDITAVTAVSGATASSNDFIALAKAAVESAKAGNTAAVTLPLPQ